MRSEHSQLLHNRRKVFFELNATRGTFVIGLLRLLVQFVLEGQHAVFVEEEVVLAGERALIGILVAGVELVRLIFALLTPVQLAAPWEALGPLLVFYTIAWLVQLRQRLMVFIVSDFDRVAVVLDFF